MEEEKLGNVKFFLPDGFLSYLEEREGTQQQEEKIVRGYKVKVNTRRSMRNSNKRDNKLLLT